MDEMIFVWRGYLQRPDLMFFIFLLLLGRMRVQIVTVGVCGGVSQ